MDDKTALNITVLIASRSYPLKIKASDEHNIRKIVKEVNEKINNFQTTYTQKDVQDCLAMTALTYAVELQKARQSQTDKELADKIHHIDHLLNNATKTKK